MLLGVLSLLLISCGKKYKYIETEKRQSLSGGYESKDADPVVITASDDSVAFLEAYEKFTIARSVYESMKSTYSLTPEPERFSLIDETGKDISKDIVIGNKNSLLKEIRDRIYKIPVSSPGVKKNRIPVDSSKIRLLSKYFNKKKDEFDESKAVWYVPKSSPEQINANGIFCYFQTIDGKPTNFRLKLQYYADEWLFFKVVKFSIDNEAISYIPMKTETDSGNGGYIWEWSDEQIGGDNTALIYALYKAKQAKMKLVGRQYYQIKNITPNQLLNIRRCVDYYRAMGGDL